MCQETQRAKPLTYPQFMHCVGPDGEAALLGVYLPLVGVAGRPRRRVDAWLSFLTPNRAWTIVSAVGGRGSLAVGGPLSCRTGSPGTYEDLHLTC